MGYKGLLSKTTSILPWNFSNKDITHHFTALVIKFYYTFGSMNVFSLTLWHLVICKVSLFSFEQKKGANFNTCYSHSSLLPLAMPETFRA